MKYARETKNNCTVKDGVEACGYKSKFSLEIGIGGGKGKTKPVITSVLLYWAILAIVSFFFGWASFDLITGIKWAGYSLALCLIAIGFFIPGLGIWMWFTYPNITANLLALAGIVGNYWINTVNIIVLSVGSAIQIIFLIWIIGTVVMFVRIKYS